MDIDSVNVDEWELSEKLEFYGNSKEFSLEGLREQLDRIPKNVIKDVIQCAKVLCGCRNISVEVIECLLEYHPDVISVEIIDEAYPLHHACMNKHCSHDVIAYLMNQYPAALRHFSYIDEGVDAMWVIDHHNEMGVSGLPLHYYLARPSDKIDMDTVLMLVKAYPESITKACTETGIMPIHILIDKERLIFDQIEGYCESEWMTVDGLRKRINNIPKEFYKDAVPHFNLLRIVCSAEDVSLEIVEYLLKEYDPSGANREINAQYSMEPSTAYALHYACKNKSCPNSVIQLLVERNPAAVSHVSVIDDGVLIIDPSDDTFVAGLPLQYYLSRKDNIDLDTVRMMVEQYPGSLLGQDAPLYWSCVLAPLDVLLRNTHCINSFEIAQVLIETNRESIQRSVDDNNIGYSSLQVACSSHAVEPRVIELIINEFPELIRLRDRWHSGYTPLHRLIMNSELPVRVAMEVMALMVKKDPDSLKIAIVRTRMYPIHLAADRGKLNWCKYLFDLDPSTLDTHDSAGKVFFRGKSLEPDWGNIPEVRSFLEAQWLYYYKSTETKSLIVRDEWGQILLHHALYDNHASLGSIKLLLEASPDSLFIADNDGIMPLHVACAFKPVEVVEYLIDYFTTSFGDDKCSNIMLKKDKWGNTPLHYACRYGKCDLVQLLLEKHQEHTTSISERNDDDKLPIHLLCDARRLGLRNKVDTESIEYTEALWLLLRQCPETIVNW